MGKLLKKGEEYNVFKCCTDHEMWKKEFLEHMKNVHGVDGVSGKKQLALHLDGDTWWQSTYKWTIKDKDGKDVIFHQYVRMLRTGQNLRIWKHG